MVNIQEYIKIHDHFINKSLYNFIKNDLFNDDLKLDKNFWLNFINLLNELEPKRRTLIKKREIFQYLSIYATTLLNEKRRHDSYPVLCNKYEKDPV